MLHDFHQFARLSQKCAVDALHFFFFFFEALETPCPQIHLEVRLFEVGLTAVYRIKNEL